MIRHPSHRFVGRSRSLPPRPTEREYSHASFEITSVRDYSPINHCFYLLLLTFIDILENPVRALGPGPTAKMRHVSPRRAVKSRCISKIEVIEVPFFCISLILSQSVSRRRSEPQISQNSMGAQRPSTEGNTPCLIFGTPPHRSSSSHTVRNAVGTGGSDRLSGSFGQLALNDSESVV
jgi:hypothetical protein